MIVKKLHTTNNISNKPVISSFDMELMLYLTEKYDACALINEMNTKHINEDFDKTGGSRVRGISGLIQSLPSLAICTAISWPITLFAGLSAISYRIQKKYEDKTSWLNRLNPSFWMEFLANSHKDKKINAQTDKQQNKSNSDFWSKAKDWLGISTGAAAGTAAGTALSSDLLKKKNETLSEIKSQDIKPYWITLSNDEVIRLRADNETNAKMMANMIISYTTKTYNELNSKISSGKSPRYTFYFTDGEKCYWSAPTKDQAYKEALKTRKELCGVFNKAFPSFTPIDDLDVPDIDGSVEVSRTEKITLPKQDSFKNITTTQPPKRVEDTKYLPTPPYRYEEFEQFRIFTEQFVFNIPSDRESEARIFIQEFYSKNKLITKIKNALAKKYPMFRVLMSDGDVYYIPGEFPSDVQVMASELWKSKIKHRAESLNDEHKRSFLSYLDSYMPLLNNIKNVSKIREKDYKINPGLAKMVPIKSDGNEDESQMTTFEI